MFAAPSSRKLMAGVLLAFLVPVAQARSRIARDRADRNGLGADPEVRATLGTEELEPVERAPGRAVREPMPEPPTSPDGEGALRTRALVERLARVLDQGELGDDPRETYGTRFTVQGLLVRSHFEGLTQRLAPGSTLYACGAEMLRVIDHGLRVFQAEAPEHWPDLAALHDWMRGERFPGTKEGYQALELWARFQRQVAVPGGGIEDLKRRLEMAVRTPHANFRNPEAVRLQLAMLPLSSGCFSDFQRNRAAVSRFLLTALRRQVDSMETAAPRDWPDLEALRPQLQEEGWYDRQEPYSRRKLGLLFEDLVDAVRALAARL